MLAGGFGEETTCGGFAGLLGAGIGGGLTVAVLDTGAGELFVAVSVPETTSVDPACSRIWPAKPFIATNSVGNTWASTAAMKTAADIENAVPAITSIVPKRNGMSAASDAWAGVNPSDLTDNSMITAMTRDLTIRDT